MTRIGGFPRINRPPPSKAATPAVEAKPVPAAELSPPAPEPTYEAEFDEEDRVLIKTPLSPPPRPAPTSLHPTPASRAAPPPVRQPGAGLLASRVGAPTRARPTFLPPRDVPKPAPATLESRPMTSIKEVSSDHRFGITPDVPTHKVEMRAPGLQERARPFAKPVPNPPVRRQPPLTPDDIPFD